jgi:hypothetical protein
MSEIKDQRLHIGNAGRLFRQNSRGITEHRPTTQRAHNLLTVGMTVATKPKQ